MNKWSWCMKKRCYRDRRSQKNNTARSNHHTCDSHWLRQHQSACIRAEWSGPNHQMVLSVRRLSRRWLVWTTFSAPLPLFQACGSVPSSWRELWVSLGLLLLEEENTKWEVFCYALRRSFESQWQDFEKQILTFRTSSVFAAFRLGLIYFLMRFILQNLVSNYLF